MRWNTRSAPVRSTRTATPGYLASNERAIFSANGRSTEVYQTTLPSAFAASISCGVTALAAGAADTTEANALDAANAVVPLSTSRREMIGFRIVVFSWISLSLSRAASSSAQHPAAFGRQMEPDRGSARDVLGRGGDHAQLGAVGRLDQIVAAGAEKDLPRHRSRHHVV